MVSPSRSTLYRTLRLPVILGSLLLSLAQMAPSQVSTKAKTSKGPRALGLLELMPGKKPPRLVPICILIDGKYYDAGAYKASPVPMALLSGTVYEALKTGESQGLFTVSTALQNQVTNAWLGEGTWQDTATLAALATKSGKKEAAKKPRGLDQDEGPPVLRRAGTQKPAPSDDAPAAGSSQDKSPAPASSAEKAHDGASKDTPANPAPATSSSAPEDADRPVLHRGAPAAKSQKVDMTPPPAATKAVSQSVAKSAPPTPGNSAQEIPAISDAAGPDPQPYKFVMTQQEEQALQKKMLGLAADEIHAREKKLSAEKIGAAPPPSSGKRSSTARQPAPSFEDVQLRVFDLSASNSPILVLMAHAHTVESPGVEYLVALVAREDINGDFHKVLSNVTDTQHLDVVPRMDLIDVVDADGDGRGELLFRRTSDSGSAYSIYRVIGDQLYPLFEGTIG